MTESASRELKTHRVMIRLTPKEREVIEREADKNGISLSAFIRLILYRGVPALRKIREKSKS